jgi:hypothetical protein
VTPPRFPRWLAAALFALYAAWALVVPDYEAPDEPAHWQYARHLREHWSLPIYGPDFAEANSPPLAYILFAPFAVDVGSPDMVVGRTPQQELRSLAAPRMFLNTGESFERFWPVRWARLLAALISLGTVIFTWRAGLAARDAPTGLVAALVAGLLPMFAFRAGQVSNDALVACASAAATWGLVRLVREPFAWRIALATSAAVAIAYLSKINAIALVPALAFALLAAEPAERWRVRAVRLAALAVAAAIVLPWTLRNLWLYGDPFASEAMRTAVAAIITDRPLLSPFFVTDFPRILAKSFVGIFGWAALTMPTPVYRAWWLFFAIGGLGVLAGLRRRTIDWRLASALALCGLGALAVVVRINLQFTQPQGRYLLPGLPAFAVLMALGLRSLTPALTRAASPLAVGLLLAAANLYALIGVVWPAFYPPPLRTLASGVRVMVPTLLIDLAMLDGAGHYAVTGAAPRWSTPIDAQAAAFDAFEVDVQARGAAVPRRACVRAAWSWPALDPQPLVNCVGWRADGTRQHLRLPLHGTPGWTGHVSHIQFVPFGGEPVDPGLEVWITDPRLTPASPR